MYVFPLLGGYEFIFFRLFGPGLGNSLLVWARALIYSRKYNLKMLEPTWNNFTLGPIIRNQIDFRLYNGIFKKNTNYLKNLKLVIFKKKFLEENLLNYNFESDAILIVKGLKNLFKELINFNDLVLKNLIEITNERHLEGLNFNYKNSITLHVRRSDFVESFGESQITCDDWFIRIVDLLRKELSSNLRVYIFTDVKDEKIKKLMSIPNAYRLNYKSSIADLLSMTKSKIFIGSKNSTFSHWVSYLGGMPTIWPKDCHINRIHQNLLRENVIESDGYFLNDKFMNECEKNLSLK
jgi:hypothetical protein